MYSTNYNYYPNQVTSQMPQTQQMPQYQSSYYRQAPPQIGLKGRLVASVEEARATSIDFDGSIFYFPDLANRRIYTKQINMDGTATLNTYELQELPPDPVVPTPVEMAQFVTREEFESVLAQLRQAISQIPAATEPVSTQSEKPAVLAF